MFRIGYKAAILAFISVNLQAMEYHQPEKMDIETKNIESLPNEILFKILINTITAGGLSEFHEKYIQLQQINKNFKRILTNKQRSNLAQDLENLVKQSVKLINEEKKLWGSDFDYNVNTNTPYYYENVVTNRMIENNYVELAKFLFSKIPNINKKDGMGCSFLYKAVEKNCMAIAKFLIDHGANVNDKNDPGLDETALHLTAVYNFIDMAKLLIDNDADLAITNKRKKTAFDIAKENGHQEMIELLTNSSNKKRKLME